MLLREPGISLHQRSDHIRPSTSEGYNSGPFEGGQLTRTDDHKLQPISSRIHENAKSIIATHHDGKPIDVAAEDPEVPPLNVSMVRSEDRDDYPLPVESDRWYRRPGWRSQRVAHFRTPLDTDNFLPGTRRATADRGVAEWRWDADAAARRWQWRRVCRLRPAAEICGSAQPARERRTSPHAAKDAVGEEERRRRVEEAVSLLLSGPAEGGGWRQHVRAARAPPRPR